MKRIRFCGDCDRYTLKRTCDVCGKDTVVNAPQRYSKDETIAKYRRLIKKSFIDSLPTRDEKKGL